MEFYICPIVPQILFLIRGTSTNLRGNCEEYGLVDCNAV
jgi:hypothetical protein